MVVWGPGERTVGREWLLIAMVRERYTNNPVKTPRTTGQNIIG